MADNICYDTQKNEIFYTTNDLEICFYGDYPYGLHGLVYHWKLDIDSYSGVCIESNAGCHYDTIESKLLQQQGPFNTPIPDPSFGNDQQGNANSAMLNNKTIIRDNPFLVGIYMSNFPSGNEPRTTSIWVQGDSDLPNGAGIFGWGKNRDDYPVDGRRWMCWYESGGIRLNVGGSYGVLANVCPTGSTDWYWIVTTYDGNDTGVCKIYVNNVLEGQAGITLYDDWTSDWTKNLRVGETIDFYYGRWKGRMSDFMVFNRELNNEELTVLYNSQKP